MQRRQGKMVYFNEISRKIILVVASITYLLRCKPNLHIQAPQISNPTVERAVSCDSDLVRHAPLSPIPMGRRKSSISRLHTIHRFNREHVAAIADDELLGAEILMGHSNTVQSAGFVSSG